MSPHNVHLTKFNQLADVPLIRNELVYRPYQLTYFYMRFTSVIYSETLNSGHLKVVKNLSLIERCPPLGSNFKNIVTFEAQHFVRYSWYVRYLGCPYREVLLYNAEKWTYTL